MALPDWIWLAATLLGLAAVIVVPRVAWYYLVSYRQRAKHSRQVRIAESRGLPPPDPPPPPNVWQMQRRFGLIGGALGLAGGLIALVVFVIDSHR